MIKNSFQGVYLDFLLDVGRFLEELGKLGYLWHGLPRFLICDSLLDLANSSLHLLSFQDQAIIDFGEASRDFRGNVFKFLPWVSLVLPVFEEAHRAEIYLAEGAEEEFLRLVDPTHVFHVLF